MTLRKRQVVSAQVMLRSASGMAPDAYTTITSENYKQFMPSDPMVAAASAAFASSGFEVGPVVGNNFSITAPVGTFERFFHTRLKETKRGGIQSQADANNSVAGEELPLRALPEPLSNVVAAVTFTPPPDFGPSNY